MTQQATETRADNSVAWRRRPRHWITGLVLWLGLAGQGAQGSPLVEATPLSMQMDETSLARIDEVVTEGIRARRYPGAVVLVGRHGQIAYFRAFGDRRVIPTREPMARDTLFDIASLTKAIATAPAIMQLSETGKLSLTARLGDLIPACALADRRGITVRQLLAHDSGLRAIFSSALQRRISGYDDAVGLACVESMAFLPGVRFRYSDLNYILLGDIVRRASGEAFDVYVHRHILEPLGMHATFFNPPAAMAAHTAAGDVRGGNAQDGIAVRMGGVSGHSGLYSTAADLARFSAMLLNDGEWNGTRIVSRESVRLMTTAVARHGRDTRGLGFDLATGFSGSRGDLYPCDSFGHTGYSGVSIWLDRRTDSFVIILTNRLHPDGRGDVRELRARVATLAATSIRDVRLESRNTDKRTDPAMRCR